MTDEDLRKTVGEAVDESVSLELLEAMGPMIHGAVHSQMVRWTRFVLVAFVLLAVAFFLLWSDSRRQAETSKREIAERVDQNCTLFETDHKSDVDRLGNTYRYLLAVRPEERGQTINQFVLNGLPDLEREARVDSAPDYCDQPKVGLPEPDPAIPRRPAALRNP